MPDGEHYELVDGILVERTMSLLASRVETTLRRILDGHCVEMAGLGPRVPRAATAASPGSRGEFVARTSPSSTRAASSEAQWSAGYVTIPPDLAVEVTSPTDMVYELEEKVEEYLRAGVRLIWVIHPEVQAIQVIRGDGSGYRLRAGDELSGEDVVPGFRCPVASLFPAPHPADAGVGTPEAAAP